MLITKCVEDKDQSKLFKSLRLSPGSAINSESYTNGLNLQYGCVATVLSRLWRPLS